MNNPQLRALWSNIPDVGCKGLCQESCGPLAMSRDEDECLRLEHGVEIPPITEALDAMPEYDCPALANGRCSVYQDRPTLCRLWGASDAMPCPWGCEPTISEQKSAIVLNLAMAVGGGVSPGAPMSSGIVIKEDHANQEGSG